jgi:hypothetical protein
MWLSLCRVDNKLEVTVVSPKILAQVTRHWLVPGGTTSHLAGAEYSCSLLAAGDWRAVTSCSPFLAGNCSKMLHLGSAQLLRSFEGTLPMFMESPSLQSCLPWTYEGGNVRWTQSLISSQGRTCHSGEKSAASGELAVGHLSHCD